MFAKLLAAVLVATAWTAEVACAADATNPRRPQAPIWADETSGWERGSAVRATRPFPMVDGIDSQEVPLPSTGKFIYGSAFLVATNGMWLTARHLVDRCRSVFIEGGGTAGTVMRLMVIEITLNTDADIALVRAAGFRNDVAPIAIAPAGAKTYDSFQVGFEQGKPAARHSRLMGNAKVRRLGVATADDAFVWAEVSRVPEFVSETSDLSGSPAINTDRGVIGVVTGESARRGRTFTSTLDALLSFLRREKVGTEAINPADTRSLEDDNYPPVARAMIQERRIARLVCELKQDANTPATTRP